MSSDKPHTAFIGVGSNVGDRSETIIRALFLLNETPDISITKLSGFYETEPFGYKEQNDFLNGVIKVSTRLSPQELLTHLQRIENELGRTREFKWGPRTIDLDILLYEERIIKSEGLIIPHPEMENRKFVLEPLAEIAPDVHVPGTFKDISQILADTVDTGAIRLFKSSAKVEQKLKEV